MTDTISNPPFTRIYNFRDVGRVINSLSGNLTVKEKSLYRAGRLDDATPTDVEKLISEYGPTTVIDLRTKSEHIKQAQTRQGKSRYQAAVDVKLHTDALADKGSWDTVYINFVGRKFELNMLKQLKWWQIMCVSITQRLYNFAESSQMVSNSDGVPISNVCYPYSGTQRVGPERAFGIE